MSPDVWSHSQWVTSRFAAVRGDVASLRRNEPGYKGATYEREDVQAGQLVDRVIVPSREPSPR